MKLWIGRGGGILEISNCALEALLQFCGRRPAEHLLGNGDDPPNLSRKMVGAGGPESG
jgi:hypothetical protein